MLINTNREAYDWMELWTRKRTHAVSAIPKEILFSFDNTSEFYFSLCLNPRFLIVTGFWLCEKYINVVLFNAMRLKRVIIY